MRVVDGLFVSVSLDVPVDDGVTVDEGVPEGVLVLVGELLFVEELVVDDVDVPVPERDDEAPFVTEGVGVGEKEGDNEIVPVEVAVLLDVEDGVTLGVAVSVLEVEGVELGVPEFDGVFKGVLP